MIKKCKDSEKWYDIIENGIIVGGFELLNLSNINRTIEFWNFTISEEFRGNGYGKKAINDVIELVKPLYDKLVLLVSKDNERALHIYNNAGFKITADNGYSHTMTKSLVA